MKGSGNICLIVLLVWTVTAVYVPYHPNSIPERRDVDKVCYGMDFGLSFSGTLSDWYNRLREIYTNCTYVDGNLIITWLEDSNINYDLSFLRDIRYVSGYVLIALCDVWDEVPLVNLEIIRGNQTVSYGGQTNALAVLLTNFTRILLPNLKEISRGNVAEISNQPGFRIDVERDWDHIMRGRASRYRGSLALHHEAQAVFRDWASHDMCSPLCPRRCFMPGPDGCCDSQCAGGCRGPRSTDCEICKDFEADGDCVSHCPTVSLVNYHPEGSRCVPN